MVSSFESIGFCLADVMAPIRGSKKRRKIEKKAEGNASASGSSEQEASFVWWLEYSKRINGIYSFTILLLLLCRLSRCFCRLDCLFFYMFLVCWYCSSWPFMISFTFIVFSSLRLIILFKFISWYTANAFESV